jgi:hypothetical protein
LFLRAFYLKYLLGELRRDEYCRRKMGIRPFIDLDLRALKRSDTLFVLASGSSINQMLPSRWKVIGQHDSVGFNYWPIHSFVPTMYFLETISTNHPREMFPAFCRIAKQRAKDYKDVVKVVTELHRALPAKRFAGSEELPGPWYTLHTFPVAASTEAEFAYGLRYLRSKGLFDPADRFSLVFKQASTLSSLISLAIRMRYKAVVLCGVDLNHSEYFYQDATLYPETAALEFSPRNAPHAINSPLPWRIPIASVILEMKRQLLDPAGIQIYVENRSSALWPAIAEAPANLFDFPPVVAGAR